MSERMSDDAHKHYLEVNQRYWSRAAEEFGKLEELIPNAELAALLSINQQMDIPFRVAECYFNLGEYKKAQSKYETLAQKWANQPQCLRALAETIKCFAAQHDYKLLNSRADEIQSAVKSTQGLSADERQQWLDWLTQVKKFPQSNPKP
jgi:tetratricopeptide (TPR) repeat protein